jgi:16S rRNA A1518/A1519 N6-dimethyltransferase RsmA/KsgA/DIM1 with predicted DNA glycosylase/AP lyase activity
VPVKDPAKAPPLKKSGKGTLRILTDTGLKQRRKTIKNSVRDMSDAKVRETLKKSKINVGASTPAHIVREILEGGMEAGMIVAK